MSADIGIRNTNTDDHARYMNYKMQCSGYWSWKITWVERYSSGHGDPFLQISIGSMVKADQALKPRFQNQGPNAYKNPTNDQTPMIQPNSTLLKNEKNNAKERTIHGQNQDPKERKPVKEKRDIGFGAIPLQSGKRDAPVGNIKRADIFGESFENGGRTQGAEH
ncbi:hypothetical protein SLA2020_185330 [Shorea laevis]